MGDGTGESMWREDEWGGRQKETQHLEKVVAPWGEAHACDKHQACMRACVV